MPQLLGGLSTMQYYYQFKGTGNDFGICAFWKCL